MFQFIRWLESEKDQKRLTGVAVRVVAGHAAADTEGVGGRLDQRHKLLVALARVWPAVRVHLATLVGGVLGPDGRINATCDLHILVGIVAGIVGAEDVALGHGLTTVLDGALAVDTAASLVRGHGADTVAGEEGAERVGRVDRGDDGAGGVDGGASHGLVGEHGRSCSQGSEEESSLCEHCGG